MAAIKKPTKVNVRAILLDSAKTSLFIIIGFPLVVYLLNALAWHFSNEKLLRGEIAELFPSYAFQESSGADEWVITSSGIVYKDVEDGTLKSFILNYLSSYFSGNEKYDKALLKSRLALFFKDLQRGKILNITICEDESVNKEQVCVGDELSRSFKVGPSSEGGIATGETVISSSKSPIKLIPGKSITVSIRSDIALQESIGKNVVTTSRKVPLVPYMGVSVISDIDDTIKVTGVGNIPLLLENTFAKEFQAVKGMAELYQRWKNPEISFAKHKKYRKLVKWGKEKHITHIHYVSSSPWPMALPLHDWITSAGFPTGTMHLKAFRIELFEPWGVDMSLLNLFRNPTFYKTSTIEKILSHFPGRKFVLVGDSSEKDPYIYGNIMRSYPDQIVCAMIRNVTMRPISRNKMKIAFRGLDERKAIAFNDTEPFDAPPLQYMVNVKNCGIDID